MSKELIDFLTEQAKVEDDGAKICRYAGKMLAQSRARSDAFRIAALRITELEEAARRWYQPDGSFILLTPEQVVEKRKAAAARIAELEGVVREVIELAPLNECADYGIWCVFCGVRQTQVREYSHKYEVKHKPDCWMVRAAALTPPTKETP